MRLLFVILLTSSFGMTMISHAYAQDWDNAQRIGGTNSEVCQALKHDNSGNLFMAGTFKGDFPLPSDTFQTIGEEDIFLAKYTPSLELLWAKSAGSFLEDEIGDLALTPEADIIVGGSFWDTISFENQTLIAAGNPKALFLIKYNTDGNLVWAQAISGATLKELNGIEVDANGMIYTSGYFEGTLSLPDTTLTSVGVSDLFLAKWDDNGTLLWVKQAGLKGNTRATALALDANGDVFICGNYDKMVAFDADTLNAATNDLDGFLAKYNKDGDFIWSKRVGGVHEDEMVDLVIDQNSQIYLAGNIVGVINLDNDQTIESASGNPNAFLIKFNESGIAQWATSLGGTLTEQVTDLDESNGTIILSGFYQGDWEFEGISLPGSNNFQGFSASFQEGGTLNWLFPLAGSGAVFPNQTLINSNGKILIAGSFNNQLQLGPFQLEAIDLFDLFLSQLHTAITATSSEANDNIPMQVYPNPARDRLLIKTSLEKYNILLLDVDGRVLFSGQNVVEIPLQGFDSGLYLVHIATEEAWAIRKVFIQQP